MDTKRAKAGQAKGAGRFILPVGLAALIFALCSGAAEAQFGVPFGSYEPNPGYLLGGKDSRCLDTQRGSQNRDVRRGQPSSDNDNAAPAANCPAR